MYAVVVIIFVATSFVPFGIRFADMLLPLTMLFGWPAIVGVTLGTLVANTVGNALLGPIYPIDVFGGSIANLLGCTGAYFIARRLRKLNPYWTFLAGTGVITLAVTLIVGTYLTYLFNLPSLEVGWLSVLSGSLVAINVLGFLLTTAIYRRSLISPEIKRLLKL